MERLNLVIASTISALHLCCSQQKPFNPLLGETLQGSLEDGTKIYCEHMMHHPPTSLFHVQPNDDSYDLFGYYEFIGKVDGNYLKA